MTHRSPQPLTPCHTLALSDDVVFPATWRAESIAWARGYKGGMSQQQVDAIEARLVAFRRKRDSYGIARLGCTVQEITERRELPKAS